MCIYWYYQATCINARILYCFIIIMSTCISNKCENYFSLVIQYTDITVLVFAQGVVVRLVNKLGMLLSASKSNQPRL